MTNFWAYGINTALPRGTWSTVRQGESGGERDLVGYR